MKHFLLCIAIAVCSCPTSLPAQVVYTANFIQSNFSGFGPQGGTIEVLYESDFAGTAGLPDDFSLSFDFATFSNSQFTFSATPPTINELAIGVNESYASFASANSRLEIETAPHFAGWNLDSRNLDQAGVAILGVYTDPITGNTVFLESTFEADDVTPMPPIDDIFRVFDLTYTNLGNPIAPADSVPKAWYTVFSDTITYNAVPEPSSVVSLVLVGLAAGVKLRHGAKRKRRLTQ